MENNHREIVERFEKVKIAEIISNKKLNDEIKHDIQKLGTIVNEVDDNLVNIKNMLNKWQIKL